ncbi:MAG: Gfo/Idh/MocA family protein [Thermoguttaceae bacterium]
MAQHKWTRRKLLQAGGAALAIPYLAPAEVLGLAGQPGPSETVNVAIIGLGGRARDIAATCRLIPAIRIAAVCDAFYPRCAAFLKAFKDWPTSSGWATYDEFRLMLDKEKLDAVMIETTTHARAWITIHAMQAGMDVYIEKPMCLTIAEGRAMVNAARRYKRVTQVGTQQRSMPINNWASDLVKNGEIGKVHTVLAHNFCSPDRWTPQPEQPMPQGGRGDWWDIWTNQAVFRPYHPQLHYGWARWWDYDGGGLCFGVTGWGTHAYDQVNRALGTDETGPVEVVLEEPVKVMGTGRVVKSTVGEAASDAVYHNMAREIVGPRAKVSMKFATGTVLKCHLDNEGPVLGAIFIGQKGKIDINRNRVLTNPKDIALRPDNPGPSKKNENQDHVANWIECIKTRQRCTADIEYGQRSTTLCYLVNIVREVGRVGETLRWDPVAERFTNCEEANQLLSRPRRKGYELPALT